MPDLSVLNEYLLARKQGKKYVAEHASDPYGGHPAVLERVLEEREHTAEIAIGTHEVKLNKIVGTYTDIRSESFAGNWMPLLAEGTEFASKWQALYAHHLQDGISDPIKVYEYLGKYYVVEGNKRVSVMNWVDAYSIRADITRLLPRYDESDEQVRIYYEILSYDPKSFAFSDLWFSRCGSFTRLIEGARRFVEHEADRYPELQGAEPHDWLPSAFRDFSVQYERAGFDALDLPLGDAFLQFILVYGFPYQRSLDELAEQVKACAAQFKLAAGEGQSLTVDSTDFPAPKIGTGFLGLGTRRAKVLFAYRDSPGVSNWTRAHESARYRIDREYGDRVTTSAVYDIAPETSYEQLREAVEREKPDILFTAHALFGWASLRISLEYPQMMVFSCNHSISDLNLNTYYIKLYEQTFLLGAIAGAFTSTGIIGFVEIPAWDRGATCAVNAFAQGARLVNHNIRVKRCIPKVNFSGPEDLLARQRLAAAGADVILCQYPNHDAIITKPVDNIYAMLCSVHPNGAVDEHLAAAAWNWQAVYDKIISDYLAGAFEPILRGKTTGSFYFWLGMSSEAAPIYKVDAALGTHTARLCELFTGLMRHARIHPFVGPMRDQEGVLRVARYDVPSLADIRSMNWLSDIVDETIT